MIDHSDEAASIMLGDGAVMYQRVASWRGTELLDDDIPISGGTEDVDVTLTVPESLSITVPREVDGVSYTPGQDQDHPLAVWGQRLHVSVGVATTAGVELLGRGWYYITNTSTEGDLVTVTASGLLGLIAEAEFISPFTPSGNFTAVTRQLVEPALVCDFTNAPTDRAVPASAVNWDTGRLDALNELMNAWPATYFIDENGTLIVQAAGDTATSLLDLSDDIGGTTMAWGAEMTRDGAANAVVARGNDATGLDVQAVSFDDDVDSPTFYGGPFNALPVAFGYSSPLLTTVAQCQAAADTILAKRQRQASRSITATAVPYLALQARDGVSVTSTGLELDGVFGVVDKLTMPLTPADGGMAVTVRLP